MGMPMLLVLANIVFIMQAFKCLSINCVHSLNSCRGGLSLFLPCLGSPTTKITGKLKYSEKKPLLSGSGEG